MPDSSFDSLLAFANVISSVESLLRHHGNIPQPEGEEGVWLQKLMTVRQLLNAPSPNMDLSPASTVSGRIKQQLQSAALNGEGDTYRLMVAIDTAVGQALARGATHPRAARTDAFKKILRQPVLSSHPEIPHRVYLLGDVDSLPKDSFLRSVLTDAEYYRAPSDRSKCMVLGLAKMVDQTDPNSPVQMPTWFDPITAVKLTRTWAGQQQQEEERRRQEEARQEAERGFWNSKAGREEAKRMETEALRAKVALLEAQAANSK